MRKKFIKLISCILVFIMLVTTFTVVASAEADFYSYTISIEDIVNPLTNPSEQSQKENNADFSKKSKKYYAPSFNTDLCVSDHNIIGTAMREVMVKRGDSLDVYYKTNVQHDQNSLREILHEWMEIAFIETENPEEGDYLRWIYDSIGSGVVDVLRKGENYYYYLPLYFEYYTTRAQENVLDDAVDEIIAGFGFSSYTTPRKKSDTIYKFITENVEYDYDNLHIDSHKLKYTAYAALINGTAVCQGYATLYYRMARECGLETRVVVGKSRNQNHAWNIVKMGSYYYYLDSTWDAGVDEYAYYLKGSENFIPSHVPDAEYLTSDFKQKYPISATDMNLADDGLSDDFDYYIYMDEAYITAYTGNDADVIVPARIEEYPVYTVKSGAFKQIPKVESITFSEGIERIEECAIENCENLKQVNYPSTMKLVYEKNTDSIKSGYTEVPMYCPNLEKVTVAAGNPYMKVEDGIVYSADGKSVILCVPKYNKTKVTILNGVEDIAPNAFYGCENLKEVVMPNTVKMIGYWAFCTSYNLEKVNLSEDCEFIGQFAFANTKLEEINIPAKVKTILGAAFGLETNLKKITVADENPNFYMQNGALIYYDDESDVSAIVDYASNELATVFTVPDNILEIEQYAFANAQNLKKIVIPDSVEYIQSYAFKNCDSLTHFAFPNGIETIKDYVLIDCDNIMSVIIPKSVTAIGDMLVYDNDGYTIYGEKGSLAETYATNNLIKFKEADNFVCTDGHTVQKRYVDDYTYRNECTVCGDCAKTFSYTSIESFAQFAKVEKEHYIYTGKEIKPLIESFEYYDKKFVEGIDYKILDYCNNVNVGYGWIEIQGIGNYLGKGYIYFEIKPANIKTKHVKLEYSIAEYDGTEKRPTVNIDGLKEFVDFEVQYSNNTKIGTATVTVTGIGNYEGTIVATFKISQSSMKVLAKFAIVEYAYYRYTGNEIKPKIVRFNDDNGTPIIKGVDYEIVGYENNVSAGTGRIKIKGKGKYNGEGYIDFVIKPASIGGRRVTIQYLETTYDGTKKCPSIQIEGLKKSVDYTVKYSNNIKIGTGIVTLTGIGNYEGVANIGFKIALGATQKVSTSLYGYNDVKVAWNKVPGAAGYHIYCKKSSSASYTYKASTTALSYNFANLSSNTKYDFKIVAYYLSGGVKKASAVYKIASTTTLRDLSAPSKVSLALYGYDDVKVSWNKVANARGYYVYYKTSAAKAYTYAGKTTSTSFKKANLSPGVNYTFKVVPYGLSGSKVVLDDSYKTASIYTLKKISTPKVVKSSSKAVKVSWTNINGESGYQISQSTSKIATKIVLTYSTTTGNNKTISALKGKTYYYKVRSFVKVGKTVIYGPWSSVKSYKIK